MSNQAPNDEAARLTIAPNGQGAFYLLKDKNVFATFTSKENAELVRTALLTARVIPFIQ